jgi:hypothetical protein
LNCITAMPTLTRKKSGKWTEGAKADYAELAAALAKANALSRSLAKKLGLDLAEDELIPPYGKVTVVAPPEELEEFAGEAGIVLAGGRLDSGERTYTVLIPSRDETCYLPHAALEFMGLIVPEGDVYKGGSVRVLVDEINVPN